MATYSVFDAPSRPLFKKLHILDIYDINNYQTCLFVYKSIIGMLPDHFAHLFINNHHIHSYNTKRNLNIHVPYCRTKIRQFNIHFRGAIVWNTIAQYSLCNNVNLNNLSLNQIKSFLKINLSNITDLPNKI